MSSKNSTQFIFISYFIFIVLFPLSAFLSWRQSLIFWRGNPIVKSLPTHQIARTFTPEVQKKCFNLSFDGAGGCWIYPAFSRVEFTAKTRNFQGYLRVWSRGHQFRGHPCKLGKTQVKRRWIKSTPPPYQI